MDNFFFAVNALAPLLGLASLGYFLRRKEIVTEEFIGYLNRYIFLVALPVLIFQTLASLEDWTLVNWSVVWFAFVMITVVTVLGYLYVVFIRQTRAIKAVLMQAFYRGNFIIIGIPLAIRLGGVEALSMMVILNAILYPLTNLYSIFTFQLWSDHQERNQTMRKEFIANTFKNPLMIAFFIGLMALVFQAQWLAVTNVVSFVPDTLNLIAATATPMAMIAIGGQFKLAQAKALRMPIFIGVFGRLVVVPSFVFIVALLVNPWIDFSNHWAPMIAIFASPVAVASVAITKGLNGDDAFASQLVLWSTAFAVISLFVFVVLFRTYGLL